MNKIAEALEQRFSKHRIVFWYDDKTEFLEQFNSLNLHDVVKIHVNGNEFEVKYKTEKLHPYGKFLLYFTKPKPANEDNWLLDMELAYGIFRTDQEALFLQEIGLGYHFKELVSEHIEFFRAKERRQKLKDLVDTTDTHQELRYKMLAVVFNTEYLTLSNYIFALSALFKQDKENAEKELERYKLKDFFWKEVSRRYNYHSENPSIYDFLLEVFNNNFSLGKKDTLNRESRLLINSWKDTLPYRGLFENISADIEADLSIEAHLTSAKIDDIIDDDLYEIIDYRILSELIPLLINEEITHEKLLAYCKQRRNKFWYNGVKNLYDSVIEASELTQLIRKYTANKPRFQSFNDGVEHYIKIGYEIDFHYRKFIWFYRQTQQNKVLGNLAIKIESLYANDWLLPYNDTWQLEIDKLGEWPNDLQAGQRRFFDNHVRPFIDKKQRVFVVISDALRFECGVELNRRFQSEKYFESAIQHGISSLPSYTKLCMASLLPHKRLQLKEGTDNVMADDLLSNGTEGRSKILAANTGVRTVAIAAEEFMSLNATKDGREFVKQHDLFYIYHNRIDKTGDDKITEEKVFDAVEDELGFLHEMVRKIANMNGTNIIITADHGFLFQQSDLHNSDFSASAHSGEIWKENRRFVIGKNLSSDTSTKLFTGDNLGLQPDIQVLIPKSINRIRVKGAGSRFVHGGASLQELVFPVIKIRRKKEDTTSLVEIDIIKSTDRITTNLLAVSFIQSTLVSDQVLPRAIRAGIYAEDGELLSDQFKYTFDMHKGLERQREVKHHFQISSRATNKYKNQRVRLRLEEPLEGSTKWKTYKEFLYTLNISFTNDFE